jgi:hypothetical protein
MATTCRSPSWSPRSKRPPSRSSPCPPTYRACRLPARGGDRLPTAPILSGSPPHRLAAAGNAETRLPPSTSLTRSQQPGPSGTDCSRRPHYHPPMACPATYGGGRSPSTTSPTSPPKPSSHKLICQLPAQIGEPGNRSKLLARRCTARGTVASFTRAPPVRTTRRYASSARTSSSPEPTPSAHP